MKRHDLTNNNTNTITKTIDKYIFRIAILETCDMINKKTNMETNTYLTLTLNVNFKFDSLMTEMLKVNVVFHM